MTNVITFLIAFALSIFLFVVGIQDGVLFWVGGKDVLVNPMITLLAAYTCMLVCSMNLSVIVIALSPSSGQVQADEDDGVIGFK